MGSNEIGLFLAIFFFSVGMFFWFGCVLSADPRVKVMAFWYAVIFENAGFLMLVVDRVTNA